MLHSHMNTETHPRTHTHTHVQQGRGIPRVRTRGYMHGMGDVPALAVSECAGAEQLVVGAAVAAIHQVRVWWGWGSVVLSPSRAHTHTHVHTRTHTRARTHSYTHTHTHVHTRTHTRTHSYTHTHTRTHTQAALVGSAAAVFGQEARHPHLLGAPQVLSEATPALMVFIRVSTRGAHGVSTHHIWYTHTSCILWLARRGKKARQRRGYISGQAGRQASRAHASMPSSSRRGPGSTKG